MRKHDSRIRSVLLTAPRSVFVISVAVASKTARKIVLVFFVALASFSSSCSGPTKDADTQGETESESERAHFGFREFPEGESTGWTPLQVSFWDAEHSHLVDRYRTVNGLRLNLWGGTVPRLRGAETGFVGMLDRSMSGAQLNVLVSTVRGSADGLQISGLGGQADHLHGIQFGSVTGAGSLRGLQIGALANFARDVEGLQIASIRCGNFKTPPTVKGCQVSLWNSARNLAGIQIGLVNFNENGWLPFCPLINFGFGGASENAADE